MVICSGVVVPMAMASMPQEFRSRFSPFEFRENGVPFVIFDSSEIFQEPSRSEMARKSNDEISEDSQFLPVTDEDTIVSHDEIMGEKNLTQARPWKATDFKQQKEALGYEKNTFDVPKGLEVNVNFWKDIYAKYNSDQGVIHDSEYIDLIYEVVDFSSINAKGDLTIQQKMKMKKNKRLN